MKNYKFIIEYDGTKYRGWQKQGNTDNTIQGKLENILEKMTGKICEVHGSGRTDSGVHAKGQVGNFKCDTLMSENEIMDYMNGYLPKDVKILLLEECDGRFHSRLNAKEKTYTYTFCVGKPSAFNHKFVYEIPFGPDITIMQKACDLLLGTHDFLGFSSLKKSKKSTVRTINSIDISQKDNCIILKFTGNGFLYNMVRILSGTILEVGLKKRDISDIEKCFETKSREYAGQTLPPCGLCLENVEY